MQNIIYSFPGNPFGIDPVDFYKCILFISGMIHCFCYRQIGVVKLYILSNQANVYFFRAVVDPFYHRRPVCQIRLWRLNVKLPAHHIGKTGFSSISGAS